MADPQFGDGSPVSILDIGQVGGTRHGASQAFATLEVLETPDAVRSADNPLPQQDVVVSDLLGFAGTRVVWRGAIRTSTHAILNTIESEIDIKRYGSARNLADGTRTSDVTQIRPTKLTNSRGGILTTDAAVLRDYRRIGARRPLVGGGAMTVYQQMELEFLILK